MPTPPPVLTDPWDRTPQAAHGVAAALGKRAGPSATWGSRAFGAAVLVAGGPVAVLASTGRRRDALVVVVVAAALAVVVAAVRRRSSLAPWTVVAALLAFALAAPSSATRVSVFTAVSAAVVLLATDLARLPTPRPRVVERRAAAAAPIVWLGLAPLLAADGAIVRSRGVGLGAPGKVAFTLAGIAVIVVIAARVVPGPLERIERPVSHAVQSLAKALSLLALLVIALPVLYLPGLVVRFVSRLAHPRRLARDGRPGWIERSPDLADVRRDAVRPFMTTAPRDRHRRVLVAAAVVSLVAAGSLFAVGRRSPAPTGVFASPVVITSNDSPTYSQLPPYLGVAWADDLQREEQSGAAHGNYVNVTDGARRTLPPPACSCTPLRVWLFGGSAAFGIGQRDEGTIASALGRAAAQDGFALDVVNFGQKGATIVQELETFRTRLERGDPKPDLAVFYDGYNDVTAFTVRTALHGLGDRSPLLLRDEDLLEYRDRQYPSLAPYGGPDEVGRLAMDAYDERRDEIREVAARHDVDTAFVYQADALSSPARLGDMNIGPAEISTWVAADMARTMASAARHRAPDVIDLRLALEDAPSPVFLSPVHHNELGAQIIAERLRIELLPRFQRLASRAAPGSTTPSD